MAKGRSGKSGSGAGSQGATTGFEAELWQMADTLRGSMDAAEYKHVVLGLIFLKYVSDAFEERHSALWTKSKRVPIPRIRTNTWQRTFSGFHPRPVGAN